MCRFEWLWCKHQQPRDYETQKSARHTYHYELGNEKQSVLSKKVLDSKGNSKMFYKLESCERSVPKVSPVEDDNTLHVADKCVEHFTNIRPRKL